MLRVLDLFSGIGGFSLGLEKTGGFKTAAFCEIEDYPRRVLRKHWPEVPIYDDVRSLSAQHLTADGVGPIDVICGGFPCQDISLAGRGAGLDGERSGLWREYARLIGELRPTYVVVENSPALRTRGLDRVLSDLSDLGYDAEWSVVSACSLGFPHLRKRMWIVAYPHVEQQGQRWRLQFSQGSESARDVHKRFSEPEPVRVADGVPHRVDRNHALANAVVPQIPEMIGRAIIAAHTSGSEVLDCQTCEHGPDQFDCDADPCATSNSFALWQAKVSPPTTTDQRGPNPKHQLMCDAPGHTDLMVAPESIDDFLVANLSDADIASMFRPIKPTTAKALDELMSLKSTEKE